MVKVRPVLRSAGHALLARPLTLGVVTLLLALSPFLGLPFGWISRFLVSFSTLMQGPRQGAVVLGWSLLPALALGVVVHPSLFVYLCVLGLLAWISASVLCLWKQWGIVLEVLALLGVIVVAGVHVYFADVSAVWLRLFTQFLQIWQDTLHWDVTAATAVNRDYGVFLSQIATGVQVSVVFAATLFHLALARFWQGCCEQEATPMKTALYHVRMGRTLAGGLLLFLLGAMVGNAFFTDGLPVLLFSFLLAGLSVFHAVMAMWRYGVWGHTCLYTLMLFFGPYVMLGLAGVGWLDVWFHCRKRVVVWKSFY